jgi:AcrR family transcriptional regulator
MNSPPGFSAGSVAPAPPEPVSHRPVRSDGVDARQRLLRAGLMIFAERGFAQASIRAIAAEAQVNLSAVSYYFGDKEGLYRALFIESSDTLPDVKAGLAEPDLPLDQALQRFYRAFLRPLAQEDGALRRAQTMHFRELAEPTGVWDEVVSSDIQPMHAALVALLMQALEVTQSDLDIERLAVAVAGMAVHFFMFHDCVRAVAPRVVDGPQAIDDMAVRLADFALAMIADERRRRAAATAGASA